ncbi:MAG: cysteine hydrolase [Deltaproteobacteria bacterium]|nr:cysteine hydrolase [Deltaproteobacteria bacterium]
MREAYVTARTLPRAAARWARALQPWARRRPFPDLGRAALLCVDLEHAFVDPRGAAFLPAARAVLPRILALRDAFRAAGLPVVWTRHAHGPRQGRGSMARHWEWLLRDGTAEARLVPGLQPRHGELVLQKRQYDAFHGTRLADWLARRGVRTVVVTGVMTHLCVETTARAAFVRDLDVVVPLDACASVDEVLHLAALRTLANGFGVVPTAAEVLREVRRAATSAPARGPGTPAVGRCPKPPAGGRGGTRRLPAEGARR